MNNNTETSKHTANQIILGAIERLDKANNPHMIRLQADLVHDLNALIGQQKGEDEHGCFLPFLPRCKSDLEGAAINEAAEFRQLTDLVRH